MSESVLIPVDTGEKSSIANNINILAMYADSFVDAGQYSKAALVYRFLASQTKRNVRWQIGLGYCLHCGNRFDEALAVLGSINTERLDAEIIKVVNLLINMAKRQPKIPPPQVRLAELFKLDTKTV